MNTIYGIYAFSIASLLLLVWIVAFGFQSLSPVDVLTLGGKFGHFDSVYDILFTFAFPLLLVAAFSVMAFSFILAGKIK